MAVCGLKIKFKSLFKAITFIRGLFWVERSLRKRKKSVFFIVRFNIVLLIVTYWISTILFNINVLLISNRLHIELIIMEKLIFIIILKKNSIKLP
jgi:hypothetical protein